MPFISEDLHQKAIAAQSARKEEPKNTAKFAETINEIFDILKDLKESQIILMAAECHLMESLDGNEYAIINSVLRNIAKKRKISII